LPHWTLQRASENFVALKSCGHLFAFFNPYLKFCNIFLLLKNVCLSSHILNIFVFSKETTDFSLCVK